MLSKKPELDNKEYFNDAVLLLQRLIATPSVSRNETSAANIIEQVLLDYGFSPHREGNNVWAFSHDFNEEKTIVLFNAHIDTVKPVASWTRNPYEPVIEDGRLYGLGANDCGGGLVSLLQVFRYFNGHSNSKYSFIFLASCEEEVSGSEGIVKALPLLPRIDVAIVGEPTGLQPAIAERGLMVLDITAHGKSGHAARGEGINAIYEIMDDLQWLHNYKFEKISPLLGETKMQVTQINAGTQHNVVPDECHIVVDIRTNEYYSNEDVFEFIKKNVRSEVKARSFRLHSSHINEDHPLIVACKELGLVPFGSPTLSDQALMPFPSFKLGPGESARSHSADEFIYLQEISDAIDLYIRLLSL